MEKEKKVVREDKAGKIILMDSAAQLTQEDSGHVVVAGSHGSDMAARYVVRFMPHGVIFNDAGKGKDNAGISGMPVLDAMQILGATVDCMTAHIGEGEDVYYAGIISAVNNGAEAAGIVLGMSAIDAAEKMLASKGSGQGLNTPRIVYQDACGSIVLTDTISYLTDKHTGHVVVGGSHCAHTTYGWVKDFSLEGIFLNDAGKGKDDQGISGLPLYEKAGIPAGAIDCMSARIGHAEDSWENGVVSTCNNVAASIGVKVGMRVQDAAKLALKASSR